MGYLKDASDARAEEKESCGQHSFYHEVAHDSEQGKG